MAQRSVYQNMRASLRRTFALLQKKLSQLPDQFRDEAKEVLAAEKKFSRTNSGFLENHSALTRSGFMAIIISARRSIPERTLSFSISKANRRGR